MAAKWQRFRVDISKRYTPIERKAIAQDIIEFIKERTISKNVDKDNENFPPYSKSYVESLNFKIGGKSEGSVDLKLSGDMLASMELLSDRPGILLIGFEKGTQENAKADGNIRGTYGTSRAKKSRARNFLGITKTDRDRILARYPLRDPEKREKSVLVSLAGTQAAE